MACTGHSINLRDGFGESPVLSRQIVQMSGSIINPCAVQVVEVVTSDGICSRVPLASKSFKYLLRLKLNCVNVVHLNYCNTSTVIHLAHESGEELHDVQPLYVVHRNSDGKFQTTSDDDMNGVDDALLKIDLALELVQCVVSSKLPGGSSFVLRKAETFYSDVDVGEARRMNQWELYDSIAKELIERNGIEIKQRRKFAAFLSCTKFDGLRDGDEYSYANIKARTSANPALGGDFLCLLGSGCFYAWPSHVDDVVAAFSNKKKVDLKQVLDDSNYRRTYGGTFATTLGTLIHELGHTFQLGHTETGLMGNDIDQVQRFFLTENFTEVLPKRNVRSCQLVEQSERKLPTDRRITKIKKPGSSFLDKYYEQKDNDMTFFEPNCVDTLRFHRWFTQCRRFDDDLSFCESERTLKSKRAHIKLVEIRELDRNNSMLIKFWSLAEANESEFQIPHDVNLTDVTLFAISSNGDTLKRDMMQ